MGINFATDKARSLKDLRDLKTYLGLQLARYLSAGGKSTDPFVRSVWELHGELAVSIEELESGARAADTAPPQEAEPPDDVTNFGYLRWLMENQEL